jgi:hypothetical protein
MFHVTFSNDEKRARSGGHFPTSKRERLLGAWRQHSHKGHQSYNAPEHPRRSPIDFLVHVETSRESRVVVLR